MTLSFYAIDADHEVVGEADQIVRCDEECFAGLVLFDVELFIFGEAEDESH